VYHSVAFESAYDKAWRDGNKVAALHHVNYTITVQKLQKILNTHNKIGIRAGLILCHGYVPENHCATGNHTENLLPPLYAVSMGAAMFSITLVPVYPTT
jgi:hypothetical protein